MEYVLNEFFNSMLFFLLTLPTITLIVSAILSLFVKKRILILGFVFIGYLIATFIMSDFSFLIYVLIYTIIAFIGTFFGDSIRFFTK